MKEEYLKVILMHLLTISVQNSEILKMLSLHTNVPISRHVLDSQETAINASHAFLESETRDIS